MNAITSTVEAAGFEVHGADFILDGKHKVEESFAMSSMTISEMSRKGGQARAAKLSPKRRVEIARAAAKARWSKKLLTCASVKAQ